MDGDGQRANGRKRGRPKSVDTPFSRRREELTRKREARRQTKLSLQDCEPNKEGRRPICSCPGPVAHGFTAAVVQQIRSYLFDKSKECQRLFIQQRVHVDLPRLRDPSKSLSNVPLHTFMIEAPNIISDRLSLLGGVVFSKNEQSARRRFYSRTRPKCRFAKTKHTL